MHHISSALPPSQARLARREARALAGAIDLLIVALIGALCAAAALTAMLLQVDPALRDPTPGEWAVGYAVFLLWLPAAALYASLSAARGQSVGARAVGLRIVADPPAAAARGLLWWPGAPPLRRRPLVALDRPARTRPRRSHHRLLADRSPPMSDDPPNDPPNEPANRQANDAPDDEPLLGPVRRVGAPPARSLDNPRRPGWSRSTRLAAAILTALAAAFVIAAFSAVQVTERPRAEQLLARVAHSLFELDPLIADQWDNLRAAAAQQPGVPVPLDGIPLDLAIDPIWLVADPQTASDRVARDIARQLYDDGFDILQESPVAVTAFLSEASAFDTTIGRLTAGGRVVAVVALIVGLTLLLPLALAALSGATGPARLISLGIALALGGVLTFILASILRGWFHSRIDAGIDPFSAQLWTIAADIVSLLLRNGAIAAMLGAALIAIAAAALWLERRLDTLSIR